MSQEWHVSKCTGLRSTSDLNFVKWLLNCLMLEERSDSFLWTGESEFHSQRGNFIVTRIRARLRYSASSTCTLNATNVTLSKSNKNLTLKMSAYFPNCPQCIPQTFWTVETKESVLWDLSHHMYRVIVYETFSCS